jgi:2-haloacid dehalogenase
VTGQLRLYHDPEAGRALGESIGDWPVFPDSAEGLGRLKALGLRLVVLSNVDNDSFER